MNLAANWLLPRATLMIILIISFPVVHAATLALTYDANGNLITGDGKYRVYDGYNQLRYVYNGSNSSGSLLQEYEYHPTEERVLSKKTYNSSGDLVETVIYFSKQNVRVINNSGTFDFQYIYHEGQLVAQVNPDGTKIFIHPDHLGSSTVVTNSTGDVIENTTYTPHGEILNGGSEIRYGYEGKEHDSILGDTDFNARRYKSEWGLFTQPDSLLPNVYDPQQLNRYMFERGNPYKYTDETGHVLVAVTVTVVAVALVAAVWLGSAAGPPAIDYLEAARDSARDIIRAKSYENSINSAHDAWDSFVEYKNNPSRESGLSFIRKMTEIGVDYAIGKGIGINYGSEASQAFGAMNAYPFSLTSVGIDLYNAQQGGINLANSYNHIYGNSRLDENEKSRIATSVGVSIARNGGSVKWYYNSKRNTYTYRVGDSEPSSSDYEAIDDD